MKFKLTLILIVGSLFFADSAVMAQKSDSNLVVKLYSGFGEHTIKKDQRIIYKLSINRGLYRGKIQSIKNDSIILTNHIALPMQYISEIGYYSKKDKTIKLVGAAIVMLGGFLGWQASKEIDPSGSAVSAVGTFTPCIVTTGIGVAMITMKLRLYKIPNPWQIQAGRDLKGDFIFK